MENTHHKKPEAPKATQKPQTFTTNGKERTDNYYWLREKEDPEVIQYLKDENAYTKAQMEDTESTQEEIFEEIKGRIKETDQSVPVKIGDFYYYTRTEEGKEYAIFCRKKDTMENDEEVLLDQNVLAEKYAHCDIGAFSVSPDHKLLAYSVDTNGSESYTTFIKDLETLELFAETIENTWVDLEWREDSKAFYYMTLDAIKRPAYVWRHELSTDIAGDAKIYEETDEQFFMGISKSKSRQYIFIEMGSKETTETRYLDAMREEPTVEILHPREQGLEYYAEHRGNEFFILTNDTAKNFRLVFTPVIDSERENWSEFVPARDDVMLDDFDIFQDFLCVYEVREGLTHVWVHRFGTGDAYFAEFPDDVYALGGGANPVFETSYLRLVYSTLVQPHTVYEYDMMTGEKEVLKTEEVLGGYDASQYVVERQYATAEDGSEVPISLAYKKDLEKNGENPCWLLGYGSYGMVPEPGFSKARVSLLDRGFVFGVAHIRGGGEKGRGWYEDGKYLNKKNTFTDFISVAEFLIEEKYTSAEKLIGYGGSAGGLLIGAVANMRPDLFGAFVTAVPFVDCVNTMMDPSIPLTVNEYEEWGNPNDPLYYDYMMSYSPYDNVTAQDYPHMLITTGLNDSRVQYWEPAKWTAKLRENKTDENLLLLKTDMEQGHAGASGRYKALRETALEYAFAFKVLGIEK